MSRSFDIVVVGAGHAGVEAALAASQMGCRVALITCSADAVARMSCNPAIGGLGKGHIVREIDALGGQMGLCTDATGIQFRRLNRRKGAAVRGTRAQADKSRYSAWMAARVRRQPGLELIEAEVVGLRQRAMSIEGVQLEDGAEVSSRATILTTGTFLDGLMHLGDQRTPGGRRGERSARSLSLALGAMGLRLGRLKTGTPSRLDRRSVDLSSMQPQPGDRPPPPLSAFSRWPGGQPPLRQVDCHITYTNERTHEIIRENLQRSPMYSGAIRACGPRYCPSIEDKVVRFADRSRHQIFVEPEGLDVDELYPNGISTALPAHVQQAFIRTIAGFEQAQISHHGYAVEYDFADPTQLDASLALDDHRGLYLAGQINGTTGYEEAAGQGLVAGINAARALGDQPPLVLRRDQAYIGVMIDDLVTKGTAEPYRMFTSRAEYRLLLREDNATTRLTAIGHELKLIDDERWRLFSETEAQRKRLEAHFESTRLRPGSTLDALLAEAGTTPPRAGISIAELLLRPQVSVELLARAELIPRPLLADPMLLEQVEIATKYRGYIDKQVEQAERLAGLEQEALPIDIDYAQISGLKHEIREKLARARPRSLGQASRIPGVTPVAIALLHVHLGRRRASDDGEGNAPAEERD